MSTERDGCLRRGRVRVVGGPSRARGLPLGSRSSRSLERLTVLTLTALTFCLPLPAAWPLGDSDARAATRTRATPRGRPTAAPLALRETATARRTRTHTHTRPAAHTDTLRRPHARAAPDPHRGALTRIVPNARAATICRGPDVVRERVHVGNCSPRIAKSRAASLDLKHARCPSPATVGSARESRELPPAGGRRAAHALGRTESEQRHDARARASWRRREGGLRPRRSVQRGNAAITRRPTSRRFVVPSCCTASRQTGRAARPPGWRGSRSWGL